jgi:hypothetical protein
MKQIHVVTTFEVDTDSEKVAWTLVSYAIKTGDWDNRIRKTGYIVE